MVDATRNGSDPTHVTIEELQQELKQLTHELNRYRAAERERFSETPPFIVADELDAQRLRAHGLRVLPKDGQRLRRREVQPYKRLIVLQRPDEAGARFGVETYDRLQQFRWSGTLIRCGLLQSDFSLDAVEDREGPDQLLRYLSEVVAVSPHETLDGSLDDVPVGKPVVVTMSEVEREAIRWLWWPYLAIGKLCMVDGDPGIGKTLLMTQIAASLSRGHPLPDQQGELTLDPGGPQTTLLLSTEDGLADTLKPRLEAAGADCTKIHVLTGWLGPDDEEHAFTLQYMGVLEAAIQQYHPRLIVIDPIQAYLGDIDMHRANETRPLLAALTRLAERYGCAIVCIRHPSKPGQSVGKAIHRGLGSIDFIGAARTALFVEQHPTDPTKALMAQSKSNIGPLGRTQVYAKAEGVFRWCRVSRLSAELMAGSGRGPDPHLFLEVVCWLEAHLRPGIPKAAKEIEEALVEEGYRGDTIKRAKKALGIRSIQLDTGWVWILPDLLILPPPLPLLPPLPLQPPLPPLTENQGLIPSGGREGSERAEEAEGAEVAVAGVVLGGRERDNGQPPPP
jgi:hypothetical protein